MLKIHAFNSYSRTKIFPCCPQCGKGIEVTLPAFIMAINLEQKYHCPDCKNTFIVKIELLDTRSPTLRAVDDSAIELLEGIKICLESKTAMDEDAVVEQISAILKAAGRN